MKTLYIDINNEQIESNDELEVLNHDLDSDFFFYLGERIAKGCKISNENALITDFNTPDNKQNFDLILSQWKEVKRILFGECIEGTFEFELPSGYLHWLRYNEDYNHVYEANFSNGNERTIIIDLEELYEDSIEDLQRKIMRKLKRDDLYLEIDEIVFNDENVSRKSLIVRAIIEKYEGIGFKSYKKWGQEEGEHLHIVSRYNSSNDKKELIWPIDLTYINLKKITDAGYTPISVIGHDDVDYVVLTTKQDKLCVVNALGHFLYDFEYSHAISTLTGKYIIVQEYQKVGLIRTIDGKELLPCTYCRSGVLNETEPGFFHNEKVGDYCAILEAHCKCFDSFLFLDKRHLRIYSKITWKFIDLQEHFGKFDDCNPLLSCNIERMCDICLVSIVYFCLNVRRCCEFITNTDADKIYILRSHENVDLVDDNRIILKQFNQTSAILNKNLEYLYKVDFVLDSGERVVSESDGMTVIMNESGITRILDENFTDILEYTTVSIDKPLSFHNGMGLYQISRKKIGCLKKNGEHLIIPWNYGNTISEFEVIIGQLILVTKTSGERFIINTSGESLINIGLGDKIRIISETKLETYNSSTTTLYEINDSKIYKIV